MTNRGYIVGGFASHKVYYLPLKYILDSRGFDVELLHPGPGGLNIWSLKTFEEEARKGLPKDKPIFLVGHSLGGIQAVWTAYLYPNVERVITIGSPVHGSPWQMYEDGIRTLLDVPKCEFDRFKNEIVPAVSSKIVTISCPYDIMAPVERCQVEGAKNYIVKTREEFVTTSHLVIPYLQESLKIIEKELS